MTGKARTLWTFAITSVALFMVSLDNLVVTTALPVIRTDLDASLEQLEWTVNAYTLTFAVFLLTGAALGDRFGRRRMFTIGLGIFTLGSVGAALAPSVEALNAARAAQGLGGAIVMPLTLTLLSAAVAPERRGLALGAWGGIGGLAIAFGPLVGGAVVEGIAWQWIFWLNVPIGLVLVPLALRRLDESRGPAGRLDLPGVALASAGLFGIVWGLVRGNGQGWDSLEIVGSLAVGAVLLAGFVAWELRARAPMLPMRFFRSRGFALANTASFLMFFGMFGSIFLLAQFFQTVQGYSPLAAGLRILPWTLAPMFIAPVAGALSDRISPKLILGTGLTLQAVALAWIGLVSTPTVPYSSLIAPFVLAGVGMALFFAPWRTSCSRPCGHPRRARPREPTTRSGSWGRLRRRRPRGRLLPRRRLRVGAGVHRRHEHGRAGRRRGRRRRCLGRLRDARSPPPRRGARRGGGAARRGGLSPEPGV